MPAKEIAFDSLHERAQALAELAHYGKCDKGGRPYIGHVQRVAAYALEMLPEFEMWQQRIMDPVRVVTTCLLHDTVEDTWVTAEILRGLFPGSIVDDTLTMTFQHTPIDGAFAGRSPTPEERREAKHRDRMRYLNGIRNSKSPYPLLNKLADLRDNTDRNRLDRLTPHEQRWFGAKYTEYVEVLGLDKSPFASYFYHLEDYVNAQDPRPPTPDVANSWEHTHRVDGRIFSHPLGETCDLGLR